MKTSYKQQPSCRQLLIGSLSALLSGCCALDNAFGEEQIFGTELFGYSISNNQAIIRAAMPDARHVVIPSEIDQIPVRYVGDEAYAGYYTMRELVIPDFIESIGNMAFSHCVSLTNAYIGTNVSRIGYAPFYYCTNLQAVAVSESNAFIRSDSGVLFDKPQTTLLQYPGGRPGHYVIPYSVTNIAESAFAASSQLSGVTLSSNVIAIGAGVFARCVSLTHVTVPDGVPSLVEETFYECTSLESITIGEGVSSIGDYCFENCTSLTGVYFRGDAPALGTNVFLDATPTVYYLEGASGFSETFGGRPTGVWVP